jgi:hypothetical protein
MRTTALTLLFVLAIVATAFAPAVMVSVMTR